MHSRVAPDRLTLRFRWLSSWCLVFALYVLGAAASFSGYFAKWAFWDGDARNSYVSTLTLQASRPFVYRQLIPELSKQIAGAIPESRRVQMAARALPIDSVYARATDAAGKFALEYHIAYLLCFSFWLCSLLILARICQDVTHDLFASLAAPLIFALIYPMLLTRGGYFYDPVELFFLAAAALFVGRGWLLPLLFITPFAAFNKESFLFWLPCLWFLFPASVRTSTRVFVLGAAAALSGTTHLLNKVRFSGNPGGIVEFHLLENLRFYVTPNSYFRREYTYGFSFPAGVSLINLALLAAAIYLGWRELPSLWKRHVLLALMINVPLLLMLCWRDELRNLSLLFVAFTVLIASVLHRAIMRSAVRSA